MLICISYARLKNNKNKVRSFTFYIGSLAGGVVIARAAHSSFQLEVQEFFDVLLYCIISGTKSKVHSQLN